ncbi:MAG TPA: hypothetical protein VEB20_24040 [Azospirillaceae bacterium]|nr:hypothetical protein [Azospirillaceae bacterium]
MVNQLYFIEGNEAYLRQADGQRTLLHYVDQSIVRMVKLGDVTGDGVPDAIYAFSWGGFLAVDYDYGGRFEFRGINPAIPAAGTGSIPHEVYLIGTGNFSHTAADEVIFARNAYDATGAAHVTYYAYSVLQGSTQRLFDQDEMGGRVRGFGDIDGDGRDDIVWQDGARDLRVKLTGAEDRLLTDLERMPDNTLVAVGNFAEDARGRDELLFFNSEARSFSVFLDGPQGTDPDVLPTDILQMVYTLPENWHSSGFADMDGDGMTDILMVHRIGLPFPGAEPATSLAYWSTGRGELVELGIVNLPGLVGAGDFLGIDG